MSRWTVVIGLILLLSVGPWASGTSADQLRGPWPEVSRESSHQSDLESSVPALAVRGALTAWRTVLTRADGPRSVMYPTASAFLGQAVAKHGMLVGIVMTADRLLHEWDEQQRAPRIVKYGISRAYDPVEANDFWWAPAPR
jgi:hypothetical protein